MTKKKGSFYICSSKIYLVYEFNKHGKIGELIEGYKKDRTVNIYKSTKLILDDGSRDENDS